MKLGVLFVLVVLVPCLVQVSSGLPWEDVQRVVSNQMRQRGTKRDLTLPPCPNHPPPAPQAFINPRFMPARLRNVTERIGQLFRVFVQKLGSEAASLGIVYDQSLVWEQGYGLINPSDPSSIVDSNTIFRIGSITKLITNIMLFKLRDEGKLSLDDPVSNYVPELTWSSPFKNNPGLTWRTLAGQTSGITGATPCNFFTIWEPVLGDACAISNAEAWKRVTSEEPTVPMWQDPHYADSAYAIIGRALESVAGMSWEDYVTQHIFKPLGMDSTYVTYYWWSDMAKRVVPSKAGNTTYPDYVAHVDLNWARPTGNVYSTVKDLAKLASVFLVGQGETNNALGIYTSTLREMLTPSFVNDDQTTAYGYPFEIYHTSGIGPNVPPYWARVKVGSMPGYFSILMMYPEIKTAMIVQSNGAFLNSLWDLAGELLPAMEQTLWDLQPLPVNPGNLTAFQGTYIAYVLLGIMEGNVSVRADLANNQLIIAVGFGASGVPAGNFGTVQAVWQYDNSFRVLGPASQPTPNCLGVESGFTNILIHFQPDGPKVVRPFEGIYLRLLSAWSMSNHPTDS